MSKTILYVHSNDELYGADKALLGVISAVLKQPYRPVVILPSDVKATYLSDELVKRGVTVYKLDIPVLRRKYFSLWGSFVFFRRLIFSFWKIINIIRCESIDIVHTNTLAVISGAVAAKIARKPHVWHVHEIINNPRWLGIITAKLATWLSDIVVCVSNPNRENLIHFEPAITQKSIVIHNGIEPQPFDDAIGMGQVVRTTWGVSEQEIIAGMVGRVSKIKGQDYFLEVANILRDELHLKFVMVGGVFPGNEAFREEIDHTRRELGLEKNVIIEPFRDDIPAVVDAFDIVLLPSTQPDSFPTIILEAMAMRKPIVANKLGGCVEMIEDGVSGYLVSPGKPDEMAKRIMELAHNKQLRINLGENARQKLETNFSMKEFEQQWVYLYRRICSDR